MNLRDIKVVAGFELRRAPKTPGGGFFLALAVTVYGYLFLKLGEMAKELGAMDPAVKQVADGGAKIAHEVLGWFTSLEASEIGAMIADHNPVLLTYFMFSLALTPFLAMLASFDQIGTDIATRHIRYLLLRTDRASLYVGKFIATAMFFAIGMGIVTAVAGLIVAFTSAFDAGNIIYLVRIWGTIVFFSLPFIAFTGLCGALTGHGALALVMAIGTQFLIWMLSSIGQYVFEYAEYVRYAFPSALKYSLAVDDITVFGKAALHMGIWGVVMFFLGRAAFARRDV